MQPTVPDEPVAQRRWLTGCVLGFGVVLVVYSVVIAGEKGPFEKPALAVMSVAILGLLTAFFAMVSRRLLASLRGKPVPHLFPPAVGLVAGGLRGADRNRDPLPRLRRTQRSPTLPPERAVAAFRAFSAGAARCARLVTCVSSRSRSRVTSLHS